jgi:hypothetical protein
MKTMAHRFHQLKATRTMSALEYSNLGLTRNLHTWLGGTTRGAEGVSVVFAEAMVIAEDFPKRLSRANSINAGNALQKIILQSLATITFRNEKHLEKLLICLWMNALLTTSLMTDCIK